MHASACDVTGRCMHVLHHTGWCMHILHVLPHDVTGQCMQLLHGLCCFNFVSDIPLLQLLWPKMILHIMCLNVLAESSWSKVYLRRNRNNRAHAITACIGLWGHGAMYAVCACIGLCNAIRACIGLCNAIRACISLWHHRLMHACTAWDLKFQVCLKYTFYPATFLVKIHLHVSLILH